MKSSRFSSRRLALLLLFLVALAKHPHSLLASPVMAAAAGDAVNEEVSEAPLDSVTKEPLEAYDSHEAEGSTALPFVLVTGANGLIGSSLVQELLKRGYHVRGSVRDPTNAKKTASLRSFPHADTHLELVAFDLKEKDPQVYRNLLSGGIEWVFHSAALLDFKATYDGEAERIEEAVGAMTMLLSAAKETPTVTQFVFTGSIAAINQGHSNDPVKWNEDYIFNEDDWTNIDGPSVGSYYKIKTLTEKAAWDFVEAATMPFRFTSLNPTIVLGPMTSSNVMSSVRLVHRLMSGKDPGLINMFVATVDIRDVVDAHINAASLPTKNTNYRRRYLLTQTEGGNLFLPEYAAIVRKEFGPMGYKIPSFIIPKWILWIVSWFNEELALFYDRIDRRLRYSNARSKLDLELNYRNASETWLDTVYSLIEHGLLPKTDGYKARYSDEL